MANRLSDKKIREMWEAWQEKQTINYVVRKCKVNTNTVKRYREKMGWDERLKAIQSRAEELENESIAQRRARHAKLGKMLQAKGAMFFRDADIESESAAIRALETGVEIENLALGDATSREDRTVRVILVGDDDDEIEEDELEELPEGYEWVEE